MAFMCTRTRTAHRACVTASPSRAWRRVRAPAHAVLAPRLKLDDLRARSLMIHIGGDNHADHPMPLGGGGGRLACGVMPSGAREP